MQTMQTHHKKINEQNAFHSQRVSKAGPMSGGLPTPLAQGRNDPSNLHNAYRSFNENMGGDLQNSNS